MSMDINKIRADFPILNQRINGYPLAYLDNAATTQKPLPVLNAIDKFYQEANANVHRGTHQLTEKATQLYEAARQKVQAFINAQHLHECIFVRGTTEAINLVASGLTHTYLKEGDEIVLSQLEHHSNIVPWQVACAQTGAHLRIIPCNDKGELLLEAYQRLLNKKVKLIAITHVSNSVGTINPIKEMIRLAHQQEIPVFIDGAQAASHLQIDVQELDCEFYAFSAHKMYGPTGIGVLFGKEAWLERLPPYQTGGEMIQSVSFEKTVYNVLPYKFEAGTPAIAQAIGLGAAIDYLENLGKENIKKHEAHLLSTVTEYLQNIPGIRLVGTASQKTALISFLLSDIPPHDVGTVLNQLGIAVRTGQLCAQPALTRFGVKTLVRASFGVYNTEEEIQRLVEGLNTTNRLFK